MWRSTKPRRSGAGSTFHSIPMLLLTTIARSFHLAVAALHPLSALCQGGGRNVSWLRGQTKNDVGLGGNAMPSLGTADTRHAASGVVADLPTHSSYTVVRA